MLIDKETLEEENEEKIQTVINVQLGGWLVDSHLWTLDPDTVVLGKPLTAVMTCKYCGLMVPQNVSTDPTFPICDKNPVVIGIYESVYKNIVKSLERDIDDRIEKFEENILKQIKEK